MEKFIVLFREPDGRTLKHGEDELKAHQANWKKWFSDWARKGNIVGGSGLTLNGRLITERGNVIINGVHMSGTEIVGGYLLLEATDFDEAVEIMKGCPVYEFGGYSEIRQLQNPS